MKIDCLSYFNPLKYSGGGEMITRALIEECRRRGYTVRLRSVRPLAILHLCKLSNFGSRLKLTAVEMTINSTKDTLKELIDNLLADYKKPEAMPRQLKRQRASHPEVNRGRDGAAVHHASAWAAAVALGRCARRRGF